MSIYKPEGLLIDTFENQCSLKNYSSLLEAFQQKKILEARAIICDSSHNLIVNLGSMKGIIPKDECAIGISDGSVRDIAIISRVNKPVCFKITGFDTDSNGNTVAILSRRLVQEQCQSEFIENLHCGDIIPARVTHLEPFGCFVDIACGIPSLIPIDAISVSRISHPRDRFRTGQDIYAIVKSFDGNRVCLSHKELLGTWEENARLFSPGETVAGIIRSIESYGIFIELTANLAGLAEPKDGVYIGQHASVYIKNLIPEKMKVKLIIVDSFEADYVTSYPTYFFNENHISRWQYSPSSSSRVLETVFE